MISKSVAVGFIYSISLCNLAFVTTINATDTHAVSTARKQMTAISRGASLVESSVALEMTSIAIWLSNIISIGEDFRSIFKI